MKITTVINFCTNDLRFLGRCLEEARLFSEEVIIVTCDHFFDGTLENRALLKEAYHHDARFIEYAFGEKLYSRFIDADPSDPSWQMYWYGTSRFIGSLYAENPDYLLFLDVDEIVDGRRFMEWLKGVKLAAYRLRSYYYFKEANLVAKNYPPNALLVKRSALNPHFLINDWDRKGAYSRIEGKKSDEGLGLDGKPLVHHYSWVRSKEECHKKANTSGHHWEKDWHALIEKHFEKGKDFVFENAYQKIENPFFNPMEKKLFPKKKEPSYEKVTRKDVLKKELELSFQI